MKKTLTTILLACCFWQCSNSSKNNDYTHTSWIIDQVNRVDELFIKDQELVFFPSQKQCIIDGKKNTYLMQDSVLLLNTQQEKRLFITSYTCKHLKLVEQYSSNNLVIICKPKF